jgi:DNA polymerase-2
MSRQGFLLQASLRPPTRAAGRPVLQLYGRLADGQTFLLTDDREVPYFYVRTADVGRLPAGGPGAVEVAPTTRRTLAGEPVSRVQGATPAAQQELVARLGADGVPTYEADLNLVARYLIDRGVRGSLEIHGAARPGQRPAEGVDLVFVNPEVSPGSGGPPLATLAVRVAVDRDGKLAAVALYDRHGGEVLRCGEPAGPGCFADERALLAAAMQRVRARDPDLLIGWDIVPIDLTTLRAAAARTRQTLALGRGPGGLQLLPGGSRGRGGPPRAIIAGRMVLDMAAVVQLVAPQVSDEAIEVVAARVLGARTPPALRPGATAGAAGEVSADQLLAEAQAIYEVTAALQLVELLAQRSRLCGLPLDRTLASVAAFDYLYLLELGRRGFVAPTFQRPLVPGESVVGGHIIAPLPGVHRGIVVLDFRSLYPSLIRTFQIDPLGLLPDDGALPASAATAADPERPIVAPSGARFRRQLGVLTVILDQIFPMRAAAKAEGDAAASQAIKLLMNSLYGVLGSPGCRFHRPELANAVTSFGRELLKWTQARVQAYGHKVVYGDTDSLFVASGRTGDSAADAVALRAFGEELAARLTRDLGEHIRATWGVESRLDLQLQTVYLRLLLTRLRRPARRRGDDTPPIERDGLLTAPGAAKRYAGLCVDSRDGERRRLVFVGMEAVRRDATDLCKEAQRTLHELLFTDRPAAELENYLHRLVSELRRGQHDAQLVYRKLLRKEPASYKRQPPHVQVAQQLGLPVGRLVRYVITRAGPQPALGATAPLDYEHYIDKQLRPAAQPVLELYGLDFDRIVGKERQLKLF